MATQQTVNVGTQQSAIFNSLVPPEGPKAVAQTLDFSQAASFLIDFTTAYSQKVISVVQTIWVDNWDNDTDVTFAVAGTGQTIIAPANSQCVLPVISAVRTKLTVTGGSGVVKCQFLNVPLPVGLWTKPSTAAAPVPAAAAAFAVAAAGVAVTPFAAGAIVNGAVIVNPYAATESLFVDVVNAAGVAAPGTYGTTVELKAGQSYRAPGGMTTAVSVNAVTAGHAFTAWKY